MKKVVKKLSLNSETLSRLDHPDLRDAVGGATRLCTPNCTATFVCSGCAPCA